jgi:TPR repeat protein
VSPTAKPAAISSESDAAKETGAEAEPVSNEQVTPTVGVPGGAAKRGGTQPAGGGDVPSLWTSVESGDTRAEVALAGRYVRGEGVPQSCAQARVLLEAAVKRGSAEAKQKLDELAQAGCQ